MSVYEFDGWQLSKRTFATRAAFREGWEAEDVWVRGFDGGLSSLSFERFPRRELPLEPPDYFKTERPDAERMNYRQLQAYVGDLRASGFDVVQLAVALHRKLAFPLVVVIMTLLAVPFAVTTGRRGALYGVGVGIVLALTYWVIIVVFDAIGSGGQMAAVLAAWAPNILFGATAVYLLLTVRT